MSASIDIGKMKFSVFGRGYDDDRLDSGNGDVIVVDKIPFLANFGAIDETGQYAWLANGSDVKKYDLTDLSEVSQSILSNVGTSLYHPCNVDNNYGVAFQGSTCTIFDLTDDTVIISGTVTYPVNLKSDVILDGTKIWFVTEGQGRSTNYVYSLDITDLTMTQTTWSDTGVIGFVTNSQICGYMPPQWYYQKEYIYGLSRDGSTLWTVTSAGQGSSAFPNIVSAGWCRNGRIYMPVLKYSSWRVGAFPFRATDYETPKPISIFGKFADMPVMASPTIRYSVVHSNGKNKTAFGTGSGVYWTDYKDLVLISSDISFPVAMDDNTILCKAHTEPYTYVYRSD